MFLRGSHETSSRRPVLLLLQPAIYCAGFFRVEKTAGLRFFLACLGCIAWGEEGMVRVGQAPMRWEAEPEQASLFCISAGQVPLVFQRAPGFRGLPTLFPQPLLEGKDGIPEFSNSFRKEYTC